MGGSAPACCAVCSPLSEGTERRAPPPGQGPCPDGRRRPGRAPTEHVPATQNDSGILVVVAAGNDRADACGVAPASVEEALTVAASNDPGKFRLARLALLGDAGGGGSGGDSDTLYSWGNAGPCVDLLAPGVDVYGACASDARCGHATDASYTWASGTSMAVGSFQAGPLPPAARAA